MDNTMLIGLTRQLTLRRQMDVVANNIANANTQGFKAERMMLEPDTSMRARHQDGPDRAKFVDEWAMGRDFSQGALTHTSRPLDLALQGDGFFMLETDAGEYPQAEINGRVDNVRVSAEGPVLQVQGVGQVPFYNILEFGAGNA